MVEIGAQNRLHFLGRGAAASGIDNEHTVISGLDGDVAAGADNHPDVVANGKSADRSVVRIGIIDLLLRIEDRRAEWRCLLRCAAPSALSADREGKPALEKAGNQDQGEKSFMVFIASLTAPSRRQLGARRVGPPEERHRHEPPLLDPAASAAAASAASRRDCSAVARVAAISVPRRLSFETPEASFRRRHARLPESRRRFWNRGRGTDSCPAASGEPSLVHDRVP